MPSGDTMIEFLKILYLGFGLFMIVAYVPNIIKMLNTDKSDSSVFTWIIWFVSSCIAILYGIFVLHDRIFTILSVGHFLGTGISSAIQIRKKLKVGT